MSAVQLAGQLMELEDDIWYIVKGSSKTGVIVLHDYWGIKDHLIQGLEYLGLHGHSIMIPDLFSFDRESMTSVKNAVKSMKQLNLKECTKSVQTGIEYMRKKLNLKAILLMGFSMGGALVWRILESVEVHGAIVMYGIPNLANLKVDKIKVPVLAIFGKNDKIKGFSDPQTVKKLRDSVQKKGMDNIQIVELENVGHGFAAFGTSYYNQKATQQSSAKIDPFIKEAQKNADACSLF